MSVSALFKLLLSQYQPNLTRDTYFPKAREITKENYSVTIEKQNNQHVFLLSKKQTKTVSFKTPKSFLTKSKKLGINLDLNEY